MTLVVTEECIMGKHTACVDNCPVECFYEGPNFLVINPEECIDCRNCVPDCPEEAIFSEEDLPSEFHHYLALNAKLSKQWPRITIVKDPLPDSQKWSGVGGKLQHLIVDPSEN